MAPPDTGNQGTTAARPGSQPSYDQSHPTVLCCLTETYFDLILPNLSNQEVQLTIRDTATPPLFDKPQACSQSLCQVLSNWQSRSQRLLLTIDGYGRITRAQPNATKLFMLRGRHVSLAEVLEHLQTLPRRHNVLTRQCRFLLALALAAATFFCVETIAAGQVVESRHVFFVPSCDREARPPNPGRPFLQLRRPFTRQEATQNANHDDCWSSKAATESVYHLAVVLCELHYIGSLRSWKFQYGQALHDDQEEDQNAGDGSNSIDSLLETCQYMARRLHSDFEPGYDMAVKSCLAWHGSTARERDFVDLVIQPLWAAETQVLFDRNALMCGVDSPWGPGSEAFLRVVFGASSAKPTHVSGMDLLGVDDKVDSRTKKLDGRDKWCINLRDSIDEFLSSNPRQRARPVRVAVLDTGIHEAWAKTQSRIKGRRNFCGPDENHVDDRCGHGTHILGLLISLTEAADVDIYVAKVSDSKQISKDQYKAIAEAINYATETWAVDVMVLAFGIRAHDPALVAAVDHAVANKTLLFAAASNSGANHAESFPAKHHGVFSVFATDVFGAELPLNPKPEDASKSFGALGLDVASWGLADDGMDLMLRRETGTSVATPILAALSVVILVFVRRWECGAEKKQPDELSDLLKDFTFMKMALRLVADNRGYIPPEALVRKRESFYSSLLDACRHLIRTNPDLAKYYV
ncbi:uncharacterized protein LMH87_007647 [Akanthomyces muscarius]|uniref:Peptidase S8/S53 domain-containing protein n=1 Tax=Akanthomyces muscarius TaxID=2231603 RepID=A0A9W8QM22_AKAMU|nr:uncharacterized protein LMH87_007647 [Akanthomyces muscarius]KAJ4161617.1 hypothetical protein LMH87_007647 [Akanthomyces muscarius]